MAFQSTISTAKAFGVIGDVYTDGPTRVQTFTLTSSNPNVIGYAYTISSEGVATVGGTGKFAGILVNSKEYALYGTTAGGPLAPTLTLPNNAIGELLTMGTCIINSATTGAIGDALYFDNTTGAISIGTAGAGQTVLPNAKVDFFTVSVAGPAVITLTN